MVTAALPAVVALTDNDTPLTDLSDVSWRKALGSENLAPATIRSYTGAVREFIRWHEGAAPGMVVTAGCLARPTAQAFIADQLAAGVAPSTARVRYAALRQFAAWLAEDGITDTDVLLGMRPPRLPKPDVDGLTEDEVSALIKACKVARPGRWGAFEALRDEAVVRLLADTGCRAGELIALTVDDVDLRDLTVKVTRAKGGKWRVSSFSDTTARALDRYIRRARRAHRYAAGPQLFLGSENRGWRYTALSKALSRRAEIAGVKGFHAHRLRHTAASRWLRDGGSEQGAMKNFGWATRSMLDRYTETDAQERAVIEARSLFAARARRTQQKGA